MSPMTSSELRMVAAVVRPCVANAVPRTFNPVRMSEAICVWFIKLFVILGIPIAQGFEDADDEINARQHSQRNLQPLAKRQILASHPHRCGPCRLGVFNDSVHKSLAN